MRLAAICVARHALALERLQQVGFLCSATWCVGAMAAAGSTSLQVYALDQSALFGEFAREEIEHSPDPSDALQIGMPDAIRKTMAAYIGLKPDMDVITHGTWAFFIDHPSGADASWAIEAPRPQPSNNFRTLHTPPRKPVRASRTARTSAAGP